MPFVSLWYCDCKPGSDKTPCRGGFFMPTARAKARKTTAKTAKSKPQKKSSYNPTAAERVKKILHLLDESYPAVVCALKHESAWELMVGVVVDTHVHRISRRLQLTRSDTPTAIEQDLMRVLPQSKWIEFSHQIIHHGRAICVARRPKCAQCTLEKVCHAADKTWSTV